MKKDTASFHSTIYYLLIIFLLFLLNGCFTPEDPTPSAEALPTNTIEPEPTEVVEPTSVPQPLLLTNPQEITPQQIGLNHDFTFEFNQPVNKDSFGNGFSIEPAVSGEFIWENDAKVTFSTTNPLSLATHYTVQITSAVYALNNQLLAVPITQNYTTVEPLKQTFQFPENQSIDIDIQTAIWVSFNQPVAETGDDSPVPITMDPAIPGSGRWANPSTYIFYPSEELVSSTTYTVNYNNLSSLYGTRFEEMPAEFSFTTQSPMVVSVEPEDLSVITPGQDIIFHFNQMMDPDSVMANLRLEDKDSHEITPTMMWNENNTQLTIQGDFARGNTVLVVLNPAAKTRTGISLNESTRRTYATTPVFTFDEKPGTSLEVQPSGYLELRFHSNVPLDPTQDFLSLIDISPRTPGEFSAILDSSGQTLTFGGFFVPGSFYSYSLSPDMIDLWGNSLGNVQFNRFATKAAPSAIMIDQNPAAPSHLYFPLDDIQVPIETSNIRRVDMQSVPLSIEGYISLYCDYSDCLQFKTFEYTRYWYQSVYPYIVNTLIPSELTMAPRFRTLDSGLYVFELDSPDLKSRDGLRYFGIASNISLTAKQIGNELLIWAVDIASMEPIPNAPILIYNTSAEVVEGGNTDAYGLLTIKDLATGTYHMVTGLPGEDQFGINTIKLTSSAIVNKNGIGGAEFFFDRPTYHPGTTVNFLVYPDGEITEDVTVQLMYEIGGETTPVEESLLLNMDGVVGLQGSFRIPESLPLGSYSLEISSLNINKPITIAEVQNQQASIHLDETSNGFTFGQEMKSNFSLLLNDTVPIPDQTISWNVEIEENGYNKAGKCITKDDGACPFSLPLEIFTDLEPSQKHNMKVTATSNLTASTTFNITIHTGDFDIVIDSETWLGYAGDAFGVEIYSRQHNQEILPSVEMEARFEKITFYDETSFEKGKQFIQRVAEETQIASTTFATDENGYARLTFTPPETGLYRISVHTNNFSTQEWFYVDGVEPGQWLENGDNITTITDKQNYSPGDSAQLFLPNPFDGPARVLLTIQNQTEYRTQVFNIQGATDIIDFAIKDTDAPEMQLSMVLLGQDENGRTSFRVSNLALTVNRNREKLSIKSELTIGNQQKGLLKINVSDADGEAIQANYSILVLPSEWINSQPLVDVFYYQQSSKPFVSSTVIPLSDYLRTNGWTYSPTTTVNQLDIQADTVFSKPFLGGDTTFLTNLSTSSNGDSFIEFPFTPMANDYTYYVVAVAANGITGYLKEEIKISDDTYPSTTLYEYPIYSNFLTSSGREDVLLSIPYGVETQEWQLELFTDELSVMQQISFLPQFDESRPASIASAMLTTHTSNILNDRSLSLQPYVDLLTAAQNDDGGWSFGAGPSSDVNLTNFIAFCLIESSVTELMEQGSLDQLTSYLTNSIEAERIMKASSRYSLQALSLTYQELSNVTAQANTLPIPEQVWLIQALTQQSDTETLQKDILGLILPMVIYDENGAYFPGDGSNALYRSNEAVTSLVLMTLSQVEPASELIPQLRSWLLHRAMTTNLQQNPVGYATVLMALQRTLQYAPQFGEFGIQIRYSDEVIEQFSSNEIAAKPYSTTITINADSPILTLIHEEGQGLLSYRISPVESKTRNPLSNGIDMALELYSTGTECRPGFCSPDTEYLLDADSGLVEAHLSLTVADSLEHVVIDMTFPSTFDTYQTIEIFSSLNPPIPSPLEYGLQQKTFNITETTQNTRLYTEFLQAGSYEIIFYIKPLEEGSLVLPAITASSQFDSVIYAQTASQTINVTWEKFDE